MSVKELIKKIIYKNSYSSDAYTAYLRSCGVTVGEGTYFFAPRSNSIDVGRGSYIKIGSYCKITQGVQILAHDYSWTTFISSHHDILPDCGKAVSIGDNVFLGWNVIVMGGVSIGNNVIVGANSVVTKNIPSNSVYAGNPAKMISTLDEYYQKKKNNALQDAMKRAKHIYDTKGRIPTDVEMGWFQVLWLERTEENWEHLKSLSSKGVCMSELKNAFIHTKPLFKGFQEFSDYAIQALKGG